MFAFLFCNRPATGDTLTNCLVFYQSALHLVNHQFTLFFTTHNHGIKWYNTHMKAILGLIMFVALIVYQWLPFLGVLAVIGGVVGLFTGSDIALRSIGVGVALIAVRYVIALVFVRAINKR